MIEMDRPSYHSKTYFTFLKETLEKQQDDLNWAKSKRDNLLTQIDRLPVTHIHKKEKMKQELTQVLNQVDIFERMVIKSKVELQEYEEKHKTSTHQNRYKRYSLAQRRAWAKGGRNSRKHGSN